MREREREREHINKRIEQSLNRICFLVEFLYMIRNDVFDVGLYKHTQRAIENKTEKVKHHHHQP